MNGTVAAGRDEWRNGWPIVLVSMIGIGTGAALYQYMSSFFVTSLEDEYDWSRSQVVTIGALALVGAFSAPFMGRIADKYGIRPVALTATSIMGAAYIGLALTNGALWQIIPLMILFGLVAPGTVGIVYARAIASWFDVHRGLALGLMTSGISLSVLIVNLPIAWLIDAYGFRAGYFALAALALCIGLPVIWRGLRTNPAEALASGPIQDDPVEGADALPSLGAILSMPRFWLLCAAMTLSNTPSAGLLTQFAPVLQGRGVSLAEGAALFTLFALAVLAGRLVIGWLFDRFRAPRIASAVTFLAAFGMLSFVDAAPFVALIPGVIAVGLVQGAEADVSAYFIGRIFPARSFSTVYGLIMTGGMVGTAIGVIGFGRLYDHYGDYDVPLMIGAVTLLIVSGLYLLMMRYFAPPIIPTSAAASR